MIATAKTIAGAYWNSIQEKKKEEVKNIIAALVAFSNLYTMHQETRDFLNHPKISLDTKQQMIHAFCQVQNGNTDVENMLLLLLQQNRLKDLRKIVPLLKEMSDEHFHIVSAVVTTVSPLTDNQKKELEVNLKKSFQAEEVELTETIDVHLLGGVVINVHGQVINNSLKTKLLRIQESLQQ
jgi:F-type H+-transporting ATPase subunit delta